MPIGEYINELEKRFEELESKTRTLETQRIDLEYRLRRTENVLVKGSLNLTSLIYEAVLDEVVAATGGGVNTTLGPFDTSQQSKDSVGNTVIPHGFYVVSAFTPTVGRTVVYNGTLITVNDIAVSITRTAATTPTRFESYINVYNLGAAVNVHVKVLKLLGVR